MQQCRWRFRKRGERRSHIINPKHSLHAVPPVGPGLSHHSLLIRLLGSSSPIPFCQQDRCQLSRSANFRALASKLRMMSRVLCVRFLCETWDCICVVTATFLTCFFQPVATWAEMKLRLQRGRCCHIKEMNIRPTGQNNYLFCRYRNFLSQSRRFSNASVERDWWVEIRIQVLPPQTHSSCFMRWGKRHAGIHWAFRKPFPQSWKRRMIPKVLVILIKNRKIHQPPGRPSW